MPHAPSLAPVPRGASAADVLRLVSDSRTPVFVTAHPGGRVRYGYWRSIDSATGRGGCYVALPTEVCEELRSAGRLTLGEPVTDPAKTTWRVSAARPQTGAGRARTRAA
ncbi:hypothetical protein [Streptomyces sp. S.PB5]|uniref:hypothetical protein n=1 Tax=Streptomyces sp. S.PB5 TaxID=3020844 RepID=UPI0025AF1ED7|nr:hypothetical protein [Streptomyces sp. S.PB5]